MSVNAKFYPVQATVAGVSKTIGILATESPDSLGGASVFRVKNDLGSCLQCRSWDGTTEGATDTYVLKDPLISCTLPTDSPPGQAIASESIPGIGALNYSYSATSSGGFNTWTRSVSGAATETDYITPPLIYNRVIYAIAIPSVTVDGQDCALLLLGPYAWAMSS